MSIVATSPNLPSLADPVAAELEAIELDIYRDVHKGLRAGLLALPVRIGRTDPEDPAAVIAVTTCVHHFLELLDDHAEHEEAHLGELIARNDPSLALRVEHEHRHVERTMDTLRRISDNLPLADPVRGRVELHRLYLATAGFTSEYLAHLGTEEVEIMPMLATSTPVDELLAVNAAIVGSIPPERMDRYLRLMAPAQNPLDRAEMYAGMRAGAPPEVFDHLLDVATDELDANSAARLRADLDLAS
jgi:hypothetical protein